MVKGLEPLTRVPFGAGPAIYHASSYSATSVTVPAPTTAPTVSTPTVVLGTFGVQPGNAAFTAGNVYDVAITFNGKTGESLIGTVVAQFTAATGQGLAVHPNAPDTTLAASANIYLRNTSGDNTWRRATDASGAVENNNCGFGDGNAAVPGMVVKYNGAGAAPPGASTATKPDGTTALGETPNQAPTLTIICGLLSTHGALFWSYSWVTENGETALSPFSSSVTAPSSTIGAWMPLYIPKTPPPGAVAIRVYAGTSATEGAMKLQVEAPIGFPRVPIHSFNASGAAHTTSNPTSELCNLQLAYNAAAAVGAGRVIASGIIQTKVPLIFGNETGDKFAIRITGEGGNNASYTQTHGKIRVEYVGTKTNATGVVVCGSSVILENFELTDPNSRLKYGLVVSDFESGGGHNNTFNNVTIRAMETGSIGISSRTNSANATAHTSDNCVYDQCTVFADAWALDFAGNQTVEHQFRHFSAHVNNAGAKANSGVVRCATQNLHFDGISAAEVGHHFFYLTNEYLDPLATHCARLNADEIYDDSAGNHPRKFLYTSPLDVNGSGFEFGSVYKLNNSGVQVYGYLFDNPTRGRVAITYRMNPDVFNYSNSVGGQLIDGIYPGTFSRPSWKTRGTSVNAYSVTLMEFLSGALGFRNEGAEIALVQTDASGNLLIAVQSGNDFRVYVAGTLTALFSGSAASFTVPIDTTGNVDIGGVYKVDGTQVVSNRETGWTAGTGTANKGAFATYAGQDVSATYVEAEAQATDDATKANSQRIKAIEDAIRVHGLIN